MHLNTAGRPKIKPGSFDGGSSNASCDWVKLYDLDLFLYISDIYRIIFKMWENKMHYVLSKEK